MNLQDAYDGRIYSAGAILTNKAAEGKKFMKHQIAVLGPPEKVFSDNGGEFTGDSLVELCEQFNIKLYNIRKPMKQWSLGDT